MKDKIKIGSVGSALFTYGVGIFILDAFLILRKGIESWSFQGKISSSARMSIK